MHGRKDGNGKPVIWEGRLEGKQDYIFAVFQKLPEREDFILDIRLIFLFSRNNLISKEGKVGAGSSGF